MGYIVNIRKWIFDIEIWIFNIKTWIFNIKTEFLILENDFFNIWKKSEFSNSRNLFLDIRNSISKN